MTDILATSAATTNPSQIIQQKPSKSLTSTIINDDEKYESGDERLSQQQQKVQVQETKSKSSQTLPTEDAKEMEIETTSSLVLEQESEQVEEPSYSQQSSEEVDEDSLSALYYKEMELALENVRKLAYYHQEALVDSICDKFADYNGRVASVNDIAAVFNRMKAEFAKEAEEPLSDSSDDEDDSDYDPNDVSDRVQVQQDLDEDGFSEIESVSGDDESDEYDSDYIEGNYEDLYQGTLDDAEDIYDSTEPILLDDTFAVELDEDEVIESDTFDAEYFEAIKCAQSAAKLDAAKIVEGITSEYVGEYEEDALADVISRVFEGIAEAQNDEVEEEEEEEEVESKASEVEEVSEDVDEFVDAEELQLEMDLALENVRKLASVHQGEFIAKISDLYLLYNGCEPSVYDLSAMFAGIKQEFADEAAEEILEEVDGDLLDGYPDSESEEVDESEKHADYNPEEAVEDIKFAEQDDEDDENIEDYLKADDGSSGLV